jgi:Cu/Ag efflux protein CusF
MEAQICASESPSVALRSAHSKNVKNKILFSLLATLPAVIAAPARNCGCDCCKGKEVCCCVSEMAASKSAEAVKRHPLRGVITAVYVERSSLMVKHEEIPGVMRAMTMLFKVDEATLKLAQTGQAITAMMSRQGDEWWLHDVKTVTTPAR